MFCPEVSLFFGALCWFGLRAGQSNSLGESLVYKHFVFYLWISEYKIVHIIIYEAKNENSSESVSGLAIGKQGEHH